MYNLVFIDIIKSFLHFPVWWYSSGLAESYFKLKTRLKYRREVLGVGVWVKYWFVPMYGQRDFTGRAISIFMRTINIIIRFFLFLIVALFYLVLILIKIILPILIGFLLINQLIFT